MTYTGCTNDSNECHGKADDLEATSRLRHNTWLISISFICSAFLLHSTILMSFVKLSIFGTSFEVIALSSLVIPLTSLLQVTTRYVDLQPVGMGQLSLRHLIHILTLFSRRLWSRLVRFLCLVQLT